MAILRPMTGLRTHPSMTSAAADSGWAALEAELDLWQSAGRTASFWWRDDDAVAWTPALQRLLELADGAPIALAVIPGEAQPELARRLASLDAVTVLQHGWRHTNHGGAGEAKSELGAARPLRQRMEELAAGLHRSRTMFGSQALPVLVPPWNRIGEDLIPRLPEIGFRGLSADALPPWRLRARLPTLNAFAPSTDRHRSFHRTTSRLRQVHVHVDFIEWHGSRCFIGESETLGLIMRHLEHRRSRRTGGDEPIGILTHHLVQDSPTEPFLQRLVATVRRHPAARFVPVPELFPDS